MPQLTGKLGTWNLPFVHAWRERQVDIAFNRTPLITPNTRVATIGSCFAEEIAKAMDRLGLNGAMHQSGLFYSSRSIVQEMRRIFSGITPPEPAWQTAKGLVHPLKNYTRAFPSEGDLAEWSDLLDSQASHLFRNAEIVVVTLGLIEAWRNPETGVVYRQIPHPEVFETLKPEFFRLTVADIIADLTEIRALIRQHTNASLIVTVSPVPLHATFTSLDVRVANTESKSRIRAAVSEFVSEFPDVHYFHSYEIVSTAERPSDFMLEDGRHVSRRGVDYILQQFMAKFAAPGLSIPETDRGFLTVPIKTAARPAVHRPSFASRALTKLTSLLR